MFSANPSWTAQAGEGPGAIRLARLAAAALVGRPSNEEAVQTTITQQVRTKAHQVKLAALYTSGTCSYVCLLF